MTAPVIETSFASGEVAPALWGHTDLARVRTSVATARNCWVGFRGGLYSRGGTRFVGFSLQDPNAGTVAGSIKPRLISFSFSTVPPQTYVLEFGELYVRFITQGGFVIDTGTGLPYQIVSPFHAVDLPLMKFTQSADTISLTHPNYPPQDLVRFSATNWTLTATNFGSAIAAPASATATATILPSAGTSPPTFPCAYAYVITAILQLTGEESIASPVANVTDSVDMSVTAGSEVVSWATVDAAQFYNIYRSPASYATLPGSTTDALPVPAGAFFGFVGSSFGNQFIDTNIAVDLARAPPQHKDPFAIGQAIGIAMTASSADWTNATVTITSATGSGFIGIPVISPQGTGAIVAVIVQDTGKNYLAGDTPVFTGTGTSAAGTLTVGAQTGTFPGVVSYFQERRVYANTLNNPDTYYTSQTGAFTNMDSSIPSIDSDAIVATPFSQSVDGIQFMVEMPLGLVTFTGGGVWQIGAPNSVASSPQALTPANQLAAAESSIGCSATVPPIKINWEIVYLQAHGYTIRDLSYQLYFNFYTTADISWQSSHLLLNHQIVEWAWAEEPHRIIWIVRDDGALLSLTYVKEQEVMGFARHDTQGRVVSVASVTEALTTNPAILTDAVYIVVERFLPSATVYCIERMNDRIWQSIDDVWAVDCGVALALPTVASILYATAGSGAGVSFFTSPPGFFVIGHVNQVIRSGGGIALITAYVSPTEVTGTWLFPCQEMIPNPDPALMTPLPQYPGSWTLAPQVTTIGGLSHLIGSTVTGLADGVPITPRIVSGAGTITLDNPASAVVAGLGFTAQVQSIYLDAGQPTVQGQRKNIPGATLRIEASCRLQAGANQADVSTFSPPPLFSNWGNLATVPNRGATYTTAGGATVVPLFTGDEYVNIPADWQTPGQVAVQQTLPLPLGLLALVPAVLPGDTSEVAYKERPQQDRGMPQQQRRRAA